MRMKPKGSWVYRVAYKKQVIKFLQKQDRSIREKVIGFFEEIKQNPNDFRVYDVKAMQGLDGYFRLRISKYRIIFSIKDDVLLIEVIKAKSRGDVYK
jgi:mRNA interferase RelE/StbE